MKHTLKIALAALACSASITATSSAALVLVVDTTNQEYFLSGSATGWVSQYVMWNNRPDLVGTWDFLTRDNFLGGDSATRPSWVNVHILDTGEIIGGMDFQAVALPTGSMTLAGNPEHRSSYADWSPAAIAELERKAAAGEALSVEVGAPNFAITFQAVIPEPSSTALAGLAGAGFLFRRKRR